MTTHGDLLDLSTELFFNGYRSKDRELIERNAYRWEITTRDIDELCGMLDELEIWARDVQ